MSSPTVSTVQPSSVGMSIARFVLPQARREGAGDVLDLPLGRGELEDQHVLGHPALVARHHRGDAQREALLAEQRVAAVARAVGPDLARVREVDDVLVSSLHGHGTSSTPSVERHADGVHAGDERRRRSPSTSSAPWPMRVMIRIETATYGRVGELDADVATCRSRAGPSRTARRTSCGPSCAPSKRPASRSRISAGRVQLFVGPASSSSLGADERAVLDAGDVRRGPTRRGRSSGAWRR